jgi:hypothetical protein
MVIGVSGKKRSGKDTVGGMVIDLLHNRRSPLPARRVAFADELKREVSEVTGVSLAEIEMDKDRWRPMLQWWGVEFRRYYNGEDYWIRQMRLNLCANADDEDGSMFSVITDVRLKNEADYIRDHGGFLIRVNRETSNDDSHSSETELDDYNRFHRVIENNGSLDDLREKVQEVMDSMRIVDMWGVDAFTASR